MARRHVARCRGDVAGLVVKEEIGFELAQKGTFFEPSEEHGFVNGQVPFHKRVNRTLMRWCTARGDERRA